MGGTGKILLDTNADIYFLNGVDGFEIIGNYKSFYYSFITEIELLSYGDESQREVILEFLKKGKSITINKKIIAQTIEIRKKYGLKIPDSIIVASAKIIGADLFSSDEKILKKVKIVDVINLHPGARGIPNPTQNSSFFDI